MKQLLIPIVVIFLIADFNTSRHWNKKKKKIQIYIIERSTFELRQWKRDNELEFPKDWRKKIEDGETDLLAKLWEIR